MDKTRKRILTIVGILIIVLMLAFFTNKKVVYRYLPNSAVNETVKKMKASSKANSGDDSGAASDYKSEKIDEKEKVDEKDNLDEKEKVDEKTNQDEKTISDENNNSSESGQFYDLTSNDLDMNYVIVAMIAEDPKSFEGVKIKISGVAVDLETTDTSGMDHYVVINDKQACCQQGLQYVLEDKEEKYPKAEETITVEGVLDVFNSEEIPFPLPIIKNAKLVK